MRQVLSLFTAVLMLSMPVPARAEIRRQFDDVDVVARAELIIVGRLERGSIEYVPHEADRDRGRGWHHRATLRVTEVLKGELDPETKELPIIIHFGLTPLVDGLWEHGGGFARLDVPEGAPPGIIQIFDTGSSLKSFQALVPDAGEDHLWFLRRGLRLVADQPDTITDRYGIKDPEDLQPLALKDYFLSYLADDTEAQMRRKWLDDPLTGERAAHFLRRREIERVIAHPDPAERAVMLVRMLENTDGLSRNNERLLWDALVATGEAGGRQMLALFDDPQHASLRDEILRAWALMHYAPAIDRLIALLEEHNRFFTGQKLGESWWNDGSPDTDERKRRYRESSLAVRALGSIDDRKARPIVEQTRQRWSQIADDPKPNAIVDEAERTLDRWRE